MDLFSHVLWTRVFTRNKLWDDEALVFALLPDLGFLLVMMYVLLGKPMHLDFQDAMATMPPIILVIYYSLHSFVTLGIVALLVWKLKPKLLPALSAWALHICMDIPFHSDVFGTRFLYPILPDFYFTGISWGDYRVLAASYFMLLVVWYYLEMRELSRHRSSIRRTDWLDRIESFAGGLINPKPISVGHGAERDNQGASGQISGENLCGPEESQNRSTGTIAPPKAG